MGESAGAEPPRHGARTPLIIAAILGVLTLVGAAVAVTIWATKDNGQQLVLAPLDEAGDDPFTASVATADVDQLRAFAANYQTPQNLDAGLAAKKVSGGDEGLYGGDSTQAVCNAAALLKELDADPAKASAWAKAQGIDVAEIDTYIAGLTPAVLSYDTLVTNHSWRSGSLHAFQAVLQAGTPVLVDAYGTPRTRCACGNPLLPPETSATTTETIGTPWVGYDDSNLRVVEPTIVPQQQIVLVDIETGGPITVPVGSQTAAGSGTPITEDFLRNATLPPGTCASWVPDAPDPLKMTNGSVPGIPAGFGFIGVGDADGSLAIGGLDGDQVDDGVAVVGCNGGGNGFSEEVLVYVAATPDAPIRVEYEDVVPTASFAPVVETVSIVGERLRMRWLVFTDRDAHCCPSRPVEGVFRIADGTATLESSIEPPN